MVAMTTRTRFDGPALARSAPAEPFSPDPSPSDPSSSDPSPSSSDPSPAASSPSEQRLRGELRDERQRLRTVVDRLPIGVALLDARGVVEALNPAGARLLGEIGPAAVGDRLTSLLGRDLARLEEGESVDLETPRGRGAGRRRVLRVEIVSLIAAGAVRGADAGRPGGGRMLTLRDVTARLRRQAALVRSKEHLERRVAQRTRELKARADQLARMASELTLAEQRERRRLAEILHENLQQLIVGAKFALGAMPGTLAADQSERLDEAIGTLDEAMEVSRALTVDLCPPILHYGGLPAGLNWLGQRFAARHAFAVEVNADDDADPGRADLRTLLFQSAREMLLNARKYSGESRARVGLRVVGTGTGGPGVELTVSDDGRGFDANAALREPGVNGGGFGLFSIRERVTLLGGSLAVVSLPGAGATFRLTVPQDGSAADGAAHPDPTADAATAAPPAAVRVLLVDDHTVVRHSLRLLLNCEADFEVIGEAADGRDGVERALELEPDVILMDFTMPRMNGEEATRRIVAALPRVRVIGLSMHTADDCGAAMTAAGASAYLSKNGDPDTLLATIRRVFAAGRA